VKKLVVGAVMLVALIAAGYGVAWWLFDPEAQRAALEQRLTETFGSPATVGKLSMSPLGGMTVVASDVRVARDPSFGEGSTFEVEQVRANLSLWGYLVSREPVIDSLVLENPRVTLVKREDGAWNWTTLGAGVQQAGSRRGGAAVLAAIGAPTVAADVSRVRLKHVEATGAEVTMVNREAEPDSQAVYKNIKLAADLTPSGDGYDATGSLTGDSAAAGGEPLLVNIPFRGQLTPPSAGGAWQVQGAIEAGHFETRGIKLEGLRSDVALDETQTLALNRLHADLYGGTLDGNIRLGLAAAGNRFESEVALANVALEGLLGSRPDVAGKLGGRLAANFKGAGDLGDFNYTLQTLEGAGTMSLSDASISTVNVLAEVARRGNLTGVTFDETGTRADVVEGAFQMNGGRIFVTNAVVTNINGYANAKYESGWIDVREPVTVSLSGSVTLLPPLLEKVRASGPMTQVLLSAVNSGQSVTVPLMVEGPLDQPAVSVRWAAVLQPFIPGAGLLPMFGLGR
jgi:hypothetical protein